jgi:hypothetical protein
MWIRWGWRSRGRGDGNLLIQGCRIRPLQMPRRKWAGIRLYKSEQEDGADYFPIGKFGDSLS